MREMRARTYSRVMALVVAVVLCLVAARVIQARGETAARQSKPPGAQPARSAAAPGVDAQRLALIDQVVNAAIKERQLPGAVVLVGRRDAIVYEKVFGNRALEPSQEPMTLDTMFDMASLTKVVATTTCAMILIEDGKIRLSDRVAAYIPGFDRYGKGSITIRQLMTHTSGLRPDLDMSEEFSDYDTAIVRATEEIPTSPPGERFVYSDINYFLLGDIIARVSGMSLDKFAAARVFGPLGMRDTMFKPPSSLRPRIAPTEKCTPLGWPCEGPGAVMMRGVVHDPTARRMGGVAGHAGLFGTATDLSLFCRMLLANGRLGQARILSPLGVLRMTTPATPPGQVALRGLGWDLDTAYSSNRGDLFPIGSYGHTGFTGTSLWVDPFTGVYVVVLSNRVHPDGKGDVGPLRAKIASIVASAISDRVPSDELRVSARRGGEFGPSGTVLQPPREAAPVLNGIDVLEADSFRLLRGKRVGLVTNQTGRSRNGVATIDLLFKADGVKLVALFSPEHGIRGLVDETVESSRDEKTGLPIHSLYGSTRESFRPTAAMLEGIDTLVIDLQDIGCRFYTYITTAAYVMEEAARRKIAVVLLDRVNPINGYQIEGPTLDKDLLGFVGYFPMPIRHGMTLGELMKLFNGENKISADLTVVPVKGWRRDMWFDDTGLPWVNPSPNMRNVIQGTLYPGIGAIEATNLSVGRGTDTPFEHVGAPWIDGTRLAAELNVRHIDGVRFYPESFTPAGSKFKGEACQGVFMIVTDRQALRPVRVGIEVAAALYRLWPKDFQLQLAARLVGSRDAIARIQSGDDPAAIAARWASDEAKWRLLRAKYLLYQ
jgi:uncharacterized protein YbbC (DUF1343 family)/CubicO group peptidase (beta-lactamase class C family)